MFLLDPQKERKTKQQQQKEKTCSFVFVCRHAEMLAYYFAWKCMKLREIYVHTFHAL